MESINENAYNIEFKLDENKAIVDGNEVDIKDVLGNVDDTISKEQIYQYLSDNIVGDIEFDGSNIKVNNPYSTNKILVKTSEIDKIGNADNIESIAKISNNIYSVKYQNAKATKLGYNSLKQDKVVETVAKDFRISALDDNVNYTNIQALAVPKGKEDKGLILLDIETCWINKKTIKKLK